jgi:glycosyltransferase involved in cell wall biosynthesis
LKQSALNIFFFTPYYHQNRGNATTAKRIEYGLSCEDVIVHVFAYEEEPFTLEVQKQMENADVVHILQFARFSKWSEKHNVSLEKPYIITSGGTDINHSLEENEKRYLPLLNSAKAITVFTDEAKNKLVDGHGFNEKHIHVIPQSVYLPDKCEFLHEPLKLPIGVPRILLPAGLRPVKDVLYAVPAILQLKDDFPKIAFLILGANLDTTVYNLVNEAAENYDWLHYLSEVDLSLMKDVYTWADVVINTSISEGQPTSLLEAMNEHKPVIVKDNTGNASIIRNGYNGLLFQNSEQLYESLKLLLSNKEYYDQLTQNGYQTVVKNHTIEKEINSYMILYRT